MQKLVNLNGAYFEADKPVIMHNNRAFCYGDALFETIRITNHRPQFLADHFLRLKKGMDLFNMNVSAGFNEEYLYTIINELIKKNETGADGKVRLTVFRDEGGLYTPEKNTASFLVDVIKIDEEGYRINDKGLKVDMFSEFPKSRTVLSTVKSASAILYVLAGLYKKKHSLDECLLLNDAGAVIESISANLFAVKNGVLYTAPIADGCLDGVMRKNIIEIAKKNRISVQEISIMQNVLLSADELFLTNSVKGIQWIGAYKQKRYFNTISKKIVALLNESVSD